MPVIESCTVLEESSDGVVTRDVVFKPGMGPKDRAREVVRGFWPAWVRPSFSFHSTFGGGGFEGGYIYMLIGYMGVFLGRL